MYRGPHQVACVFRCERIGASRFVAESAVFVYLHGLKWVLLPPRFAVHQGRSEGCASVLPPAGAVGESHGMVANDRCSSSLHAVDLICQSIRAAKIVIVEMRNKVAHRGGASEVTLCPDGELPGVMDDPDRFIWRHQISYVLPIGHYQQIPMRVRLAQEALDCLR